MLNIENISIGYTSSQPVYSNIHAMAEPGDMIALLGVNGIGKSTLLRTIAGLQTPAKGNITLNGHHIHTISAAERATQISMVLTERIFIDNITVKNFISLGRAPYTTWLGKLTYADELEIDSVIKVMKIEALQHRLFNQLSDGEKQKALIARALCQQTPLMILDEPTAFLDFKTKREVLQTLKTLSNELNKIIIFSTHDIEASLQYCNKCWIMNEAGAFKEIIYSGNFKAEVMESLSIANLNS